MGIKKFTGTFIEPLPTVNGTAYHKVVAIYIDSNQFLYSVVNNLKSLCTKRDENNYSYNGEESDFWQQIDAMCKSVIHKEMIEPLLLFTKLRHITACLDGTACIGKILQQFLRRKTSIYFNDSNGRLLLSDSMILPGSQLVRLFASNLTDMFRDAFASQWRIGSSFHLTTLPAKANTRCWIIIDTLHFAKKDNTASYGLTIAMFPYVCFRHDATISTCEQTSSNL